VGFVVRVATGSPPVRMLWIAGIVGAEGAMILDNVIYVRNQTVFTMEFCCGENEYALSPEEEITIEIKDGDCMYFDEVYVERNPQEDTRIRRIRR
jgi:hypothetical protein